MYLSVQADAADGVSPRVADCLRDNRTETPFLVIDLERVARRYAQVQRARGPVACSYAVKANPHPQVLARLAAAGACFDVASPREIRQCLEAGAAPADLSYGSTLKKERDIAYAHRCGVGMFACDSHEELEKIARAAPGARVFCRLMVESTGAQWPLARKFGCDEAQAEAILARAPALGLVPYGLSFHVGSQMLDVAQWESGIAAARRVWDRLAARGIAVELLNLGGGLPARNSPDTPTPEMFGVALNDALARHFADLRHQVRPIAEIGRAIVADAGVLQTEVVLVSRRPADAPRRWVYLDVGVFHGLAETIDEAVRYPIATPHDGKPSEPVVIAGPTCDSFDVIYERAGYSLPLDLATGERIQLLNTGAYTYSYSAVEFNGFPPLQAICV